VPGGNRDRWAFALHDADSTVEIAHTAEMPTKLSLPLLSEFDAEIPDYPDCGDIWHQPCRSAELNLDEDGDETDDDQRRGGTTRMHQTVVRPRPANAFVVRAAAVRSRDTARPSQGICRFPPGCGYGHER